MKGLNYCATMLRKGKESDEKSENKGGEKMLDETLKSVKEAEAKAAAVLQKGSMRKHMSQFIRNSMEYHS